ncbi:hypothetical protein HIM_02131 [Hirsutella minnesotensis 3608]|nr:hypothetical protein HIM_02131 [Hirsutella minnesotensis 3608]
MHSVSRAISSKHQLALNGQRRCGTRRRQAFNGVSAFHDLPPWPTTATPSPYEVLNIEPNSRYSKTNFRRLVKLYHPDLCRDAHATTNVPRATCLERYRLVVAANELLGDLGKRRAYDAYNVGWVFQNSHPPGVRRASTSQDRQNRYREQAEESED